MARSVGGWGGTGVFYQLASYRVIFRQNDQVCQCDQVGQINQFLVKLYNRVFLDGQTTNFLSILLVTGKGIFDLLASRRVTLQQIDQVGQCDQV